MKKKLLTLVLLAVLFITQAAWIVSAFNEVYDGNSALVNTSTAQNYAQINFRYIAFVHVNAKGSSNYDANLPLGYLDWENIPYKPDNYSDNGKE